MALTDDPLLCHINLTRPRSAFPDYDEWVARQEQRGFPVCNGYCETIDKWAVQAAGASVGLPVARAVVAGDADELLVVKTRANHLGKYDRLLSPALLGDLYPPPWLYPERVRVVRRGELSITNWADPSLTIERFVSNREGMFHRAYVVGPYVGVATSRAEGAMKEMYHRPGIAFRSVADGSLLAADDRDPLSVAFRLAQAMRADYAAIDLAVDDAGVVYAIDLNTTPWWGDDSNDRLTNEMAGAFALLAETRSLYAPCTDAASAR